MLWSDIVRWVVGSLGDSECPMSMRDAPRAGCSMLDVGCCLKTGSCSALTTVI